MRSFDDLYKIAVTRKGSAAAVEKLMPTKPKSTTALRKIPDHRWLAEMTKRVFQAGFNWQVIENKWEGFEKAFDGFDPNRWAMMSDDDLDQLVQNKNIVRNPLKIKSVQGNALFLTDLAKEHGSASQVFADWPNEDFIGSLELVKKRGSRLGGATAQYLFRFMGKDAFITSRDVTLALIREGIVAKAVTSKRDLKATQDAFNQWQEQSGRSFNEISRLLALTVESDQNL